MPEASKLARRKVVRHLCLDTAVRTFLLERISDAVWQEKRTKQLGMIDIVVLVHCEIARSHTRQATPLLIPRGNLLNPPLFKNTNL